MPYIRFALILALAAVAQAASPTPVTLTNPGFEAPYNPVPAGNAKITGAVANGWQDNSSWADVTVQYAQETNSPHGGASCQKITVTAVGSGQVQLIQPISLQAGSLYTASFWMRGDAGALAMVAIFQSGASLYGEAGAMLTGSWQQFTVQGYATTSVRANLMLEIKRPGTVWVDDASASFTPGVFSPAPNPGAISPSFFGMHDHFIGLSNPGFEAMPFQTVAQDSHFSGYVANGWTYNRGFSNQGVSAVFSEDSDHPHGGACSQKVDVQAVGTGAVVDVYTYEYVPPGQYTMTAWLRGAPGMTVNLVLDRPNPYAMYATAPARLTADWQQFSVTGQVPDTGVVQLLFQAAVPGTFSVDDVSFRLAGGQPVAGGAAWPPARFGTLRVWEYSTSWSNLAPAKGVWNFDAPDAYVAAAQAGGVHDIILELGQTPFWASSKPDDVGEVGTGAPAPPANIQDWRDYVTAVAQRYKGVIRYYEIWNEPNLTQWYTGTVAQLVDLAREAYAILKSVDPQNTVISPAVTNAPGYLDLFLQAGGGKYVDVIGYHFYDVGMPPEDTVHLIADVRLVMAKNGAGSLPLWDTESGIGDNATPDDLAAAYIVRKYLTNVAFGVGRSVWFKWGSSSSCGQYCVGTQQNDWSQPDFLTLTKAGEAYRYLYDWLLGASLTNALIDSSGNWQIWLTLADGSAGLIVSNPTATQQFTIPSGIHPLTQRDIFGGMKPVQSSTVTVGAAPILLSSCCATPPLVNAVTNAGSFTSRVSPGSLATIFGTGFAPAPAQAQALPLPTTLSGVSILVNGFSSPLLYVGPNQINFQVPFATQPTSAVLLVNSALGTSAEYQFSIDAAAPGILQYGNNRAVATDAFGTLNTAASPQPAGSVVVVYLTGIGSLTTTPADGAAAPGGPLAQAVLPASATIGGVNAPLQFLGLTPGYVGLAQANVQVPSLAAGDYPLIITVNGVASTPATVSVSAPSR